MHASPVVPNYVTDYKNESKSELQFFTFDCLFCYFKSYIESNFLSSEIKTKLFVNQNVCFKLIKKI